LILLLPIGLVDAPPTRFPWMSLALGLSWILFFVATPDRAPDGAGQRVALRELHTYWNAHPYLVPTFGRGMAISEEDVEAAKDEANKREHDGTLPDAATLGREQTQLGDAYEAYLNANRDPSRKWGIVPRRGIRQPGWLSYMFVHGSWSHLLGNLLFFLVVGPSLESLLGWWAFLLFFLVSGVLAGGFEAFLSPASPIGIIGASGAIASCMGLFTVHYAQRRVKVLVVLLFLLFFWWIILWRNLRNSFVRVVPVPAWLCGGAWMLSQLWDLLSSGSGSGVAVGAHAAGFCVGVGSAFFLAVTGLERKLTPVIHDREQLWRKDLELEEAQTSLAATRLVDAERGFLAVLARRPNSAAACWGLAQLKFLRDDRTAGTKLFDRAVTQWLVEGDDIAVQDAIVRVGTQLDLSLLRASLLSRVARELESVHREVAIQAYEAAARSGADKAKQRLTELQTSEPVVSAPDQEPAWNAVAAPLPTIAPVSAIVCSLAQVATEGVVLRSLTGRIIEIPFREIRKITVAMVSRFETIDGTEANVLLTDFNVDLSDGESRVYRVPAPLIPLASFYPPEIPPMHAYYSLIAHLAEQSGASVWPQVEYLGAGQYPQFADTDEFERFVA
jgi:membrane associated rhomboid family serine protease